MPYFGYLDKILDLWGTISSKSRDKMIIKQNISNFFSIKHV